MPSYFKGCEVYGLFSDLLQAVEQAEGGDLEYRRSRQGLIPDFCIRLPTPEGISDSLAELKILSAGVTWYPRGVVWRGTERRAAGLPALYRRKLLSFMVQLLAKLDL